MLLLHLRLCGISIHAPTRGATNVIIVKTYTARISIHAPTRGATETISRFHGFWKFQSTLPRGERHIAFTIKRHFILFQSTLPRGERHPDGYHYDVDNPISIHAPTRGATAQYGCTPDSAIFQSTLPRGERRLRPPGISRILSRNFNPRSHEGSD